ncbi:hypothetical protein AB4089_15075 [Arthrobacter sp. 2MCAF15]|uniref:hypothetical protein n=1 Tax=Arthrobacter sp. 2MCAF15 TaxID=3232984 RepID=UPI003F8F0EFB
MNQVGDMSFLGLFRRRVVHVEVQENPSADQPGAKKFLARYTVRKEAHTFPFDQPKSLFYSNAIKKDVKRHFSWLSGLFLLIKIWREDGVDESPPGERRWARGSAIFLFIATVLGTAVALFLFSQALQQTLSPALKVVGEDDFNPAVQAVLLGNVCIGGATAAGVIGVRALRFSEPFETSVGWLAVHLGPVMLSMLFNLALMAGWFGWDTAAVKAMLAPVGLVFSVLAAAATAAFSTLRWTAIEEIQRKEPGIRWLADWLYRRKVI